MMNEKHDKPISPWAHRVLVFAGTFTAFLAWGFVSKATEGVGLLVTAGCILIVARIVQAGSIESRR